MKLQKQKAYKYKDKTHYKYTLVLPDSLIDQLSWKEGSELDYIVDKKRQLLLKPLTKENFSEIFRFMKQDLFLRRSKNKKRKK